MMRLFVHEGSDFVLSFTFDRKLCHVNGKCLYRLRHFFALIGFIWDGRARRYSGARKWLPLARTLFGTLFTALREGSLSPTALGDATTMDQYAELVEVWKRDGVPVVARPPPALPLMYETKLLRLKALLGVEAVEARQILTDILGCAWPEAEEGVIDALFPGVEQPASRRLVAQAVAQISTRTTLSSLITTLVETHASEIGEERARVTSLWLRLAHELVARYAHVLGLVDFGGPERAFEKQVSDGACCVCFSPFDARGDPDLPWLHAWLRGVEAVPTIEPRPQCELVPCGHKELCVGCLTRMAEDAKAEARRLICPMCRAPVRKFKEV